MPSSRHLALAGSLALGLCLIAVVSAATGSWAHVRSTAGGSHRFAVLAVLLAVGVVWLAIAARLAGADAARVVRHFGSVSLVTVGAVVLAAVAIGFVWQHPTSVPPPTRCQGVNLHSSRYSYCLGPGALLDCRQGSTNPACQFWCPMKLGVEFCPRVPGGGAAGAAGGRLRGGIDAALIEAALAGAAAVLLAGAAFVRWLRRRRRMAQPESAGVSPLVVFVDESVEDLRREADVRRAIEACYARMEWTLARVGLVRAGAEAPLEYLERTSARFGVARSSLERLTGLFEEAKFSRHALGEPTREEAIEALLALRAEAAA